MQPRTLQASRICLRERVRLVFLRVRVRVGVTKQPSRRNVPRTLEASSLEASRVTLEASSRDCRLEP